MGLFFAEFAQILVWCFQRSAAATKAAVAQAGRIDMAPPRKLAAN
jgi:hypothetical protein